MSETNLPSIESHPDYVSIINEKVLLAEKNRNLEESNKELEEENQKKQHEIEKLRHNLEILKKHLFGSKSEKIISDFSPDQLRLLETDLSSRPVVEKAPEIEVKPHKRRKRKRYIDADGNETHFPPELPREEIPLEPKGGTTCKSCGKEKKKLKSIITEKLCTIPAKFYVKKFIQPVYGCSCGGCAPEKAAAPYSPLPKTVLDISFLASILTQKFGWHLPFYRQSQMLKELGIDLSRDVLISAANKLGQVLNTIVLYMLLEIKRGNFAQMDESPIVVARRDSNGKAKYKRKSYYWSILDGKQVVFTYTGNRDHCNVEEILGKDFSGVLLSDGYQAYLAYSESHPDCSLALCWDHARRKFHDIKDTEPLALEALEQIKVFYRVEKEIKALLAEEKLQPDKIPKYRKEHALPALNEFKKWCETVRDAPEVLPKDALMGACSYVINHWEGLTLYLEHGFVPISNILAEHQNRNLKLGAKNWLFAASEAGADTIAVMNSLVCTCKMNGINILEYFTDILGRLDSDTAKNLTPLAWMREQAAKNENKNAD